MTIESKHFYPAPTGFDHFFKYWAEISYEQAQELAKMDNECGQFNRERIAFITKLWNSYLEVTGRKDTNNS